MTNVTSHVRGALQARRTDIALVHHTFAELVRCDVRRVYRLVQIAVPHKVPNPYGNDGDRTGARAIGQRPERA